MTGRERLDNVIVGNSVDKLPNLTDIGAASITLTGVTIGQWAQDYKRVAEAALLGPDAFKIDYYSLQTDLLREAGDFGCAVEFYDDKLPTGKSTIIHSTKDAADLRPVTFENGPRMQETIRTLEIIQAQTKQKDFYMIPMIAGPATVLSHLRGVNELMIDFYDDIEMVDSLLAVVNETLKEYITAMVAAGAQWIYVADPVASLVSPDFYQSSIFSTHKAIFDHITSLGAHGRLHMCGNIDAVLPTSIHSGAKIIDIDHGTDYKKAVELADNKVLMNGNIDPVDQVYASTPAKIIEEVKKRHVLMGDYKALIMPGCEIPFDTPLENILALHQGLLEIAN